MATHDLPKHCPSPSRPAAPPLGETTHAHLYFQAHVLGGHRLPPPQILGVGAGHHEGPCSAPGASIGSGLGEGKQRAPTCACLVFPSDANGTFLSGPQPRPPGGKVSASALRERPDPEPQASPDPPTRGTAQAGRATLEGGSPLGVWRPAPKCWDRIPGKGVVGGTLDAWAWRGGRAPQAADRPGTALSQHVTLLPPSGSCPRPLSW